MVSEKKIKFKWSNRRRPTVCARSRAALRHAARNRTTRRHVRMYKGHGAIILVPAHEAAGSRANRSIWNVNKNVSWAYDDTTSD